MDRKTAGLVLQDDLALEVERVLVELALLRKHEEVVDVEVGDELLKQEKNYEKSSS